MHDIPDGLQNFFEWLIESLCGFLEGIIGPHLVQRTFWFFATVFIFILSANWAGLVPGVGSIGWGHQTTHGFIVEQPLLRGANADVNMTLAMALVFSLPGSSGACARSARRLLSKSCSRRRARARARCVCS
jgi:F-type H+-transporting ATPase subunit a